MRIGLEVMCLLPGEMGWRETCARELLSEMLRLRPDPEFVEIAAGLSVLPAQIDLVPHGVRVPPAEPRLKRCAAGIG